MIQTFSKGAVPTRIGDFTIQVASQSVANVPAGTNPQGATQTMPRGQFFLQLTDDSGREVRVITGDLVPYLTPAQAQGLVDLMQALRIKAVAEAL